MPRCSRKPDPRKRSDPAFSFLIPVFFLLMNWNMLSHSEASGQEARTRSDLSPPLCGLEPEKQGEPEQAMDIAVAALELTHSASNDPDMEKYLHAVEALALSVKEKIPENATSEEAALIVIAEIFRTFSVDHSRRDFDPMEGFLAFVLEHKTGNCLGLSTLLLAVGQRLELPFFLVQAPTHVFVRYDDGESRFNIETTDQGSQKPDSYYIKRYRITPGRPFLHNLTLSAAVAEFHRNRGLAWKKTGDWEKAIAEYDRAAELDPMSASVFLNRAYALSMTEAYDKALEDYNRTIELDPGCALSFLGRGYLWGRFGENEKAIQDYTASIEINPRDGQAYANRGYIWFLMDDFDKAIEDCTQALAINPDNAQALNNRGHGWIVKGEYAKAVADHIRAMELDASYSANFAPFSDGPLGSWRLYTPERYAQAIDRFTSQIESDPGYAPYYYYRGFVWCEMGCFQKAQADLTKTIELNPFHRWALIKRAEVFEQLGKPHKARKDRELAEALNAGYDPSLDGE
ncbi:MAG: tetratricopeptide repeat protein [Planctomycetota bacterium]